jgi:hypothetical protein
MRVKVPGVKLSAAAAREAASWRSLRPKGMSGRQWRKMRKREQLLTPKKARRACYERHGFYGRTEG